MNINNTFILLIIIIIILLSNSLIIFNYYNKNETKPVIYDSKIIDNNNLPNNKIIANDNNYNSPSNINLVNDYIDPIYINNNNIKNYDYSKLYDPYTNPYRRANQNELPFIELQKNIDLPTRGYPDNYILLGLLIENHQDHYNYPTHKNHYNKKYNKSKSKLKSKLNKKCKRCYEDDDEDNYESDNKIVIINKELKKLKLFGRQIYPGSDTYEYYALDDNFGNYIKYEISHKYRELYNNDKVYINGFNSSFTVDLYKRDMPRYFPHIL